MFLGIQINQPVAVLSHLSIYDRNGLNLPLKNPVSNDDGTAIKMNDVESVLDQDLMTGVCLANQTKQFVRMAFDMGDVDPSQIARLSIASQTSPYGTQTQRVFVVEYSVSGDVNDDSAWIQLVEPLGANWQDGVLMNFDLLPPNVVHQDLTDTTDTGVGTITGTNTEEQTVITITGVNMVPQEPNACVSPAVTSTVNASVESVVDVGYSGVKNDMVLASVCVKISIPQQSVQQAILNALQNINWATVVAS